MNNKKALNKSVHVFPTGKKAQIGSTISWFVAVITIFLILAIFLVFSGLIAVQKISWSDMIFGSDDSVSGKSSMNYFNLRGAVVFLESPYENKTIRQYASSAFLSPLALLPSVFGDLNCFNFCANYFPDKGESCVGKSEGITFDKRITILLIDLNRKSVPDAFKRNDKLQFGGNYGC